MTVLHYLDVTGPARRALYAVHDEVITRRADALAAAGVDDPREQAIAEAERAAMAATGGPRDWWAYPSMQITQRDAPDPGQPVCWAEPADTPPLGDDGI